MSQRWKQFSGNWTVTQQVQAKGAGTWPEFPGAPTIGTATVVGTDVEVSFTAPANPGYPATLSYTATSSPGGLTGTGSASPITVTGFSAGVAYTFTVTATNDTGTGPASAASNSVTPVVNKELYGSGANTLGQLGLNDTIARSSPTQVGALNDWASIVVGQNGNAAATKRDGTVWSWGLGATGRTGQNNTVYYSSPVQIGALSNWSALATYREHTLSIKTDGTLWAWGNGANGRLGDNSVVTASSPIQIGSNTNWASCAAGERQGAAITTSGVLYAWGRNNVGQVGVNNKIDYSSPVQVGSGYAMVSAGADHMLAIKTNGTLWSWGVASQGRLGLNSPDAVSSPTQVGALTNWEYVSAGRENSHAIRAGIMYGWGAGSFIGNNTTINASSPVQVTSASNWTRVASTNESIVAAIRSDGSLWGWGRNENGELGQGNRIPLNASSPIQVGAGRTWTDVDTADTFMMYIEEV